jgi:hypothetical protein
MDPTSCPYCEHKACSCPVDGHWRVPPAIVHAIGWMALAWALFIAALFSGCVAEPDAGAGCPNAFAVVLAQWEATSAEPVPDDCQRLDEAYMVRVVPIEQLPWGSCDPLAVGCTVPGHGVIYLLEGRSQRDTSDTLVHEWIHALSECAIGDLDVGHYRAGLWLDSRPTSIEARAQEAAGECQ